MEKFIFFGILISAMLIGTFFSHAFNYFIAVKYFDNTKILQSAFFCALMGIPFFFVSNLLFSYYFGIGSSKISYVVLSLISTVGYILISLLIQYFFQKYEFSSREIIGIFLMLFGIFFTIIK